MTGPISLTCRGVSFTYGSSEKRRVLSDVSFETRPGEFISVVGPSGCGKTTLLRIIAGLLTPSEGTVAYAPCAKPRRSFLFQEHALFPWLTVLQNVAFGLEALGAPRAQREAPADALIAGVGLADYRNSFPSELSVGMRQRVSLCRALLIDPEVLLLDEPFSALDALSKRALQEELLRIWSERGTLTIHVTHDIDEAIRLSDRILVLSSSGQVIDLVEIRTPRPRAAVPGPQEAATTARVWAALADDVRRALFLPVGGP